MRNLPKELIRVVFGYCNFIDNYVSVLIFTIIKSLAFSNIKQHHLASNSRFYIFFSAWVFVCSCFKRSNCTNKKSFSGSKLTVFYNFVIIFIYGNVLVLSVGIYMMFVIFNYVVVLILVNIYLVIKIVVWFRRSFLYLLLL